MIRALFVGLISFLTSLVAPFRGVIHATERSPHQSLWELSATSIDGDLVPLANYKGQVLLIVNTASRCGFTSQYEGLEKLYQTYRDKGFTILGFPSNDFMGQEPGTNEDIKKFCKLQYDVTFPMFSKAPVYGSEKQPVFHFLTTSHEGHSGEIRWNFEKFLIGKDGKVRDRFRSTTGPSSESITKAIERALNE